MMLRLLMKIGDLVKCHRKTGFNVIGIIIGTQQQHELSWCGLVAYKVFCAGEVKIYTSAGIRGLNESR